MKHWLVSNGFALGRGARALTSVEWGAFLMHGCTKVWEKSRGNLNKLLLINSYSSKCTAFSCFSISHTIAQSLAIDITWTSISLSLKTYWSHLISLNASLFLSLSFPRYVDLYILRFVPLFFTSISFRFVFVSLFYYQNLFCSISFFRSYNQNILLSLSLSPFFFFSALMLAFILISLYMYVYFYKLLLVNLFFLLFLFVAQYFC